MPLPAATRKSCSTAAEYGLCVEREHKCDVREGALAIVVDVQVWFEQFRSSIVKILLRTLFDGWVQDMQRLKIQ